MMQRLRGYLVLALSLFIFMMWAINLLSLAQTEITVPGSPGGVSVENQVHSVRVLPFLALYLREAGFDLDWTTAVPTSSDRPLLIVDPPRRLPTTVQNQLLPWVRRGGKLVFFFTSRQSFADSLGAGFGPSPGPLRPAAHSPFPGHSEARAFSVTSGFLQARSQSPFHRFYRADDGRSSILTTWRGSGDIYLVGGSDFLTYEGLSQANNLVWVTRTLEMLSPDRRLSLFDPELSVQVTTQVRKTQPGKPDRKVKNPYLSLWSLIIANPISWVLLQLLFGLIMYFYAVGRRFNRPLPLKESAPSIGTFLEGMGCLLNRHGVAGWTANRFLLCFLERIRPRLGLSATDSTAAVAERFAVVFPEPGKRFAVALQSLEKLATISDPNPEEIVRHIRVLESIRKELNIHD